MKLRHLALRLALSYLGTCAGALPPIEEIFDIPNHRVPNSCWNTIYAPKNTDAPLHKWWRQIEAIEAWARNSLTVGSYNQDPVIRKSLFTYFSIRPNYDDTAPTTGADFNRLHTLRYVFDKLRETIHNPIRDLRKPKLLCGTKALIYQRLTDCAFDYKGQHIMKTPNRCLTLAEWETQRGFANRLADSHYFHYDISAQYIEDDVFAGDHKYVIFRKRDLANDPITGLPSAGCVRGTEQAFTVDGQASVHNTLPQNNAPIIVLCVDTWESWRENNELNTQSQAEDGSARADSLETNVMTLLHELFHLALGGQSSPDLVGKRCKARDAGDDSVPLPFGSPPDFNKWPGDWNAWQDHGGYAIGPEKVLQIGLWEREAYKNAHGGQIATGTLSNPESLAWWAYTNFIQRQTGQDWSIGVCRPGYAVMDDPQPLKRTANSSDEAGWDGFAGQNSSIRMRL